MDDQQPAALLPYTAREPRRYSDVVFDMYISPTTESSGRTLGDDFVSSYIVPPELRPSAGDAVPLPQFLTGVSEEILPSAFESEDSKEIVEGLRLLASPQLHDAFVARAVRLSLDLPLEKQKFLAATLTVLYDSKLICRRDLTRGFEKLICQVEDTFLDVPTAYVDLMTYLNCLIADGCLDADWVDRLPEHFLRGLLPVESSSNVGLRGSAAEEVQLHLRDLKAFKDEIGKTVDQQFLVTGSTEDLQSKLADLLPNSRRFRHEVVRTLVKVGMGANDSKRQLVSDALSSMYGVGPNDLHPDDIYVGFCRLLEQVEDLSLDIPSASTLLAKFVIRAIVDEILPPAFVTDAMRLRLGSTAGRAVARTVKKWAVEERRGLMHISRFQDIWSSAASDSPQAKLLAKTFRDLLQQHFLDRDIEATAKCLVEQDLTPDQLNLFVMKAIQVALESDVENVNTCVALLHGLLLRNVLGTQEVLAGFKQIERKLPEVLLDVPFAGDMLRLLVARARSCCLIPEDVEIV